MAKLDGKVAVVTGAARGLGRAYAKRLAGLGAKVAVTDLNLHSYEELEAEAKDMTADSTVAEIEALGGNALGIEVDVRDHKAVEAMVGRVVQEWARVDVHARQADVRERLFAAGDWLRCCRASRSFADLAGALRPCPPLSRQTGVVLMNLQSQGLQPYLFGGHVEIERMEKIYAGVDTLSRKYGKGSQHLTERGDKPGVRRSCSRARDRAEEDWDSVFGDVQ